jgi:hypothetical protein
MMTLSTSDPEANSQAVAWLLDRMKGFWGKAFADKWSMLKPGEMLDTWTKATKGLSEIEFRRGVAKLKEFERPPSLPEFLKACRPEVNPLTAYYEAMEGVRSREQGEAGTWSHPAIFWASVRVSAFELKTQSYSAIRQRWEVALAAELAKNRWDEIPAPMVALPAPGKTQLSREGATKMLQQLKAQSNAPPKTAKGDGKDWARKILQREKDGEQLLPIQREFARQALRTFDEDENG